MQVSVTCGSQLNFSRCLTTQWPKPASIEEPCMYSILRFTTYCISVASVVELVPKESTIGVSRNWLKIQFNKNKVSIWYQGQRYTYIISNRFLPVSPCRSHYTTYPLCGLHAEVFFFRLLRSGMQLLQIPFLLPCLPFQFWRRECRLMLHIYHQVVILQSQGSN